MAECGYGRHRRAHTTSDWTKQPEVASTIYGTTTHHPNADQVVGFAAAVDHLRHTFDPGSFDDCVQTGAAMNLTEAVRYAHRHINTTRQDHR